MRVFRSPSLATRVVALAVLLAASVAVLGVGALVADLSRDYASSQSQAACDLAERPSEWSEFLSGTARDLLVYIPLYLVLFVAVVAITSRTAVRPSFRRLFAGRFLSDGVALVIAVTAAAADVVETLLYRRTLQELEAGRSCETLTTATDVTAAFTALKFAMFVLFAVLTFARVLARPTPRD